MDIPVRHHAAPDKNVADRHGFSFGLASKRSPWDGHGREAPEFTSGEFHLQPSKGTLLVLDHPGKPDDLDADAFEVGVQTQGAAEAG